MTTDLIKPGSRCFYYSFHGVYQEGILIGYGYIASSDAPDIYLIEIEPYIIDGKVTLPLNKVVGVEIERVGLVGDQL